MDGKYKTRNVDSIIQELESLNDDISMDCFSDDNTVHNVEYLTVRFESVTDDGLKKLNKRTTVQMNNEAIELLKNLGIYINAHFIVNPVFTIQDFSSLLRYVEERNLFRPAYPVLTPLPGTQLYEETRNKLVIRDYDYFDFAHSIMPTKLKRREFYFQLAQLYNKSYSLIRYFKYIFNKKIGIRTSKPDGISILKLILIRIFAVLPYFKMKNTYRSEPVHQE
jgi:hypothetical protein